jgi:hypothetical protein
MNLSVPGEFISWAAFIFVPTFVPILTLVEREFIFANIWQARLER